MLLCYYLAFVIVKLCCYSFCYYVTCGFGLGIGDSAATKNFRGASDRMDMFVKDFRNGNRTWKVSSLKKKRQ